MPTTAPNQTSHPAQVDILNFGHFDFDIVSDFDISISDFRLPDNALPNMTIQSKTNNHLSLINNHLAMPAEAQNLSRQMILRAYKALILPAYKAALLMSRILYNCRGSFTNRLLFMQNKPNSQKDKINATLFATRDYENKPPRPTPKNKPKTNPKQTQTNPISEKPKMNLSFYSTKVYDNKPPLRAPGKQTQNKPKQTQSPHPQSPHLSQLPTPRNTKYDIRHTLYAIRHTIYEIQTQSPSLID